MRRRSPLVDRPAWLVGARLVAAASVLALLGGCGGEDPAPTPTSPSSPMVPESTSPTTSSTQAAESAEEFIRRWVELNTEMQNTGVTGAYLRASRGCRACVDVARKIEKFYEDGGFVKTEGWRIVSIRAEGETGGRLVFRVSVDSAPTSYSERRGGSERHLDGGAIQERFELRKRGEDWVVVDLSQYAS